MLARVGYGLLVLVAAFVARAQSRDFLPVHTIPVQAEGRSARLWLTLFDEDTHVIRIMDNAAPGDIERYKTMDAPLRVAGALAGANGSFFNRSPFEPVGLMISEGRQTGRFDPQSWMKGVLVVRDGRMTLEASDRLALDSKISAALQSGPWLVRGGRAETDNSATQAAARTFIGHNGKGLWFLGVSNECTLRHLSIFLRSEPVRAVIDAETALNFDGGPSTGLWVRGEPRDFYRQEKWPARNYVAVVRRPALDTKTGTDAKPSDRASR